MSERSENSKLLKLNVFIATFFVFLDALNKRKINKHVLMFLCEFNVYDEFSLPLFSDQLGFCILIF